MNYKVGILAILGAISFLILQWIFIGYLFDSNTIDQCYFDRYNVSQQHHQPSVLPKVLFWATILCFILLGVRAKLNPPPAEEGNSKKTDEPVKENYFLDLVFYLGSGTTFYSITYCLSKVIEYFLNDNACSKHQFNGISGHYLFHVYFILLFFYLRGYFHNLKNLGDLTIKKTLDILLEDIIYVIVLGAAICLSSITLSWTWLGGFHSARQILYGVLLAIASHVTFVFLSEKLNPVHGGAKYRVNAVMGMIFTLVILLLISTVIGTWPFSVLDFAATVVLNVATVYIAAQD